MSKLLFGNVALLHGYCEKCQDTSFCSPAFKCLDCGEAVDVGQTVKRVSKGIFARKQPTLSFQRAQIERQNNKCYWCGQEFGEWLVSPGGRSRRRQPCWDHFIPFSYTGSCDDLEFVAACQVCNGVKSNHMFDSEDEARLYIVRRAAKSRWQAAA